MLTGEYVGDEERIIEGRTGERGRMLGDCNRENE